MNAYAPRSYRDIAYAFILKLPLNLLLYIPEVIEKPSRENNRRLRHAVTVRLVKASKEEIIRTFLIKPSSFRKLIRYLKIPLTRIDGKTICNENIVLVRELCSKGVKYLFEKGLKPSDLLRFNIPLHQVLNYLEQYTSDPMVKLSEIEAIARSVSPKEYLRHARLFRSILGDRVYEKYTRKVIDRVDVLEFMGLMDHLVETGVLTPSLRDYMEKRIREVVNRVLKGREYRLALLVDVSGSMVKAKDVAIKLLELLYYAKIKYIIAFNDVATLIDKDRLKQLEPENTTSIGSGLLLLYNLLKKGGEKVDAVILVSDLCENTSPYASDILKLYSDIGNPPLVIVHVGQKCIWKTRYPHVILELEDYHRRLCEAIAIALGEVIDRAVRERELLEVISVRKPLEEEIMSTQLPVRPKETLKKGYLVELLAK